MKNGVNKRVKISKKKNNFATIAKDNKILIFDESWKFEIKNWIKLILKKKLLAIFLFSRQS